MISGARSVPNPQQKGKFRAEISGFDPFLITKLKLPKSEVEEILIEAGGQTIPVPHAGSHKGFKFDFEAIVPGAGELRDFLWKKHKATWTRNTKEYYFDMTVIILGPDDNPTVAHVFEDAWIRTMEAGDLDSTNQKDMITVKCECSCSFYDQQLR